MNCLWMCCVILISGSGTEMLPRIHHWGVVRRREGDCIKCYTLYGEGKKNEKCFDIVLPIPPRWKVSQADFHEGLCYNNILYIVFSKGLLGHRPGKPSGNSSTTYGTLLLYAAVLTFLWRKKKKKGFLNLNGFHPQFRLWISTEMNRLDDNTVFHLAYEGSSTQHNTLCLIENTANKA